MDFQILKRKGSNCNQSLAMLKSVGSLIRKVGTPKNRVILVKRKTGWVYLSGIFLSLQCPLSSHDTTLPGCKVSVALAEDSMSTHFLTLRQVVFETTFYSLKAVMGSRINSPLSKRSMEREEMSIVFAFPSRISSEITLPTAGLC